MVTTLLQQMQDKFQTMSDQIIGRIDEMSARIDDLEKNIADLMTQAGVEEIEGGENKTLPDLLRSTGIFYFYKVWNMALSSEETPVKVKK
ncbi:heat shock factor-binding protein 1b isoform X3 [Scyliorhinus canicula]|uniref:heat shock factor-binding protein 1b isoform X3 n=1 Tax=Scyliorhinus canicula TaxID=7830 RepID=UPI0018F4CB55|nr:heat shock factor-binding protein 1b isoform X3 [Scyliorhinus canicula]